MRGQTFHTDGQRFLARVPEITIFFWIIKLLTTAMGESTSDYLVHVINPVVAVLLGGIGFAISLIIQFRAGKYVPWKYWLAVLMVAIFGTMVADVLHIGLGVPYLSSTIFFAVSLLIVFVAWYAVEKTLSIHSIYNTRREVFYWLTVVTTFALGTAAGDMTAVTLGWGYFYSGVLFAVLIAGVTLTHYIFKAVASVEHRHLSRNAVIAFWSAYIITRPLGASFADWTGKPQSFGGLGLGDGVVSFGLLALIVCFVWYLTKTHVDVERHVEPV
jgi:uncharacterized membrane-anchored protein